MGGACPNPVNPVLKEVVEWRSLRSPRLREGQSATHATSGLCQFLVFGGRRAKPDKNRVFIHATNWKKPLRVGETLSSSNVKHGGFLELKASIQRMFRWLKIYQIQWRLIIAGIFRRFKAIRILLLSPVFR